MRPRKRPIEIGSFTEDLPPGKWVRVHIPLTTFRTASVHAIEPHRMNVLVFLQGAADATQHTLLLDDIRIADDPPEGEAAPPGGRCGKGLRAAYRYHVEAGEDPALAQYVIYRSIKGAHPSSPSACSVPG